MSTHSPRTQFFCGEIKKNIYQYTYLRYDFYNTVNPRYNNSISS